MPPPAGHETNPGRPRTGILRPSRHHEVSINRQRIKGGGCGHGRQVQAGAVGDGVHVRQVGGLGGLGPALEPAVVSWVWLEQGGDTVSIIPVPR